MCWLLVIKEEYSGMLYTISLPNKEYDTVFQALYNFKRWVKRQFNFSIYKIRQDNERAVIAINGIMMF